MESLAPRPRSPLMQLATDPLSFTRHSGKATSYGVRVLLGGRASRRMCSHCGPAGGAPWTPRHTHHYIVRAPAESPATAPADGCQVIRMTVSVAVHEG